MGNTPKGERKDGKRPNIGRPGGTGCIWPRGMCERYGISKPTLLRWERQGKLPKRDVYRGGEAIGWRPETVDAWDRGEAPGRAA